MLFAEPIASAVALSLNLPDFHERASPG